WSVVQPSEAGLGTFSRSPVFMHTYRRMVHLPAGASHLRWLSRPTRAVRFTRLSAFGKAYSGNPAEANTPRGPFTSPSVRLSRFHSAPVPKAGAARTTTGPLNRISASRNATTFTPCALNSENSPSV